MTALAARKAIVSVDSFRQETQRFAIAHGSAFLGRGLATGAESGL